MFKKIAAIVLFIIIASSFCALILFLLKETFSTNNRKLLENFQGAFMGAFFAFLFIRLSEALNKFYQRENNNHSAIIKIQHYLNECLRIVGENLFVIRDFEQKFNGEIAAETIRILTATLTPLPIDQKVVLDLLRAREKITLHFDISFSGHF